MFKKSARLTQSEFAVYFKGGKRHHFPFCIVITAPAIGLKTSVVVGKKVAKLAVKRNRIRRRIYAGLRGVITNTNFTGVIMIIIKPAYNTQSRVVADATVIKSIAQVLKST